MLYVLHLQSCIQENQIVGYVKEFKKEFYLNVTSEAFMRMLGIILIKAEHS
jgi:hypothetical protein